MKFLLIVGVALLAMVIIVSVVGDWIDRRNKP